MAAISSALETTEIVPALGLKMIMVQSRDDVDATNTFTVDLAANGIAPTGLLWVIANVHTTSGSVMTIEAVTTSVTAGVLTVTVPAGTDNDVRTVLIVGKSTAPTFAA